MSVDNMSARGLLALSLCHARFFSDGSFSFLDFHTEQVEPGSAESSCAGRSARHRGRAIQLI